MSTRISSAFAIGSILILGACSADRQPSVGNGTSEFDNVLAQASADADDDGRIVCAPAGNAAFSRQCTLDRVQSTEGLILTIHKPDGGFRRLLVVKDGRGVVAADGAEPAKVTIVADHQIEVAIGGDRFRLPATMKGKGASTPK